MTFPHKSTIKDRVERTLHRLGYTAVPVSDQGQGKISLSCVNLEHNEVCIVKAGTKNVAGVTNVLVELK